MATVSSEIRPVESQVSARLGLLGYLLALLAIVVGWNLNRAGHLVNPEEGLGYWLGIVGASMMGILLLYPIRKRVRWLRFLGTTAHWFRVHIFFGVLGPVLVLYHCNFGSASMNATVALAFTLFVAGSGIVGRYLHAKIYSDLDGHKRSLREMKERARLRAEDDDSRSAILVPQLLERMQAFDGMVMTPPESFLAILVQPLKVSVLTRLEAVNLRWYTAKQLRVLARKSVTIALERKKLKRATNRFVGEHLRRVRRIAAFSSCERLFSLWHVFHLPFFYMLIVTALLHVLAVHMY